MAAEEVSCSKRVYVAFGGWALSLILTFVALVWLAVKQFTGYASDAVLTFPIHYGLSFVPFGLHIVASFFLLRFRKDDEEKAKGSTG